MFIIKPSNLSPKNLSKRNENICPLKRFVHKYSYQILNLDTLNKPKMKKIVLKKAALKYEWKVCEE